VFTAVRWTRHVEHNRVVEVGDVASERVALGPVIDERARDVGGAAFWGRLACPSAPGFSPML